MATTAIFLKYLDKENRNKAFEKFKDANPAGAAGGSGRGTSIFSLIEDAARVFTGPLVNAKEIVGDLDAVRYREIMVNLRGDHNEASARGLLPKIFAEWMKKSLGETELDDAGTERFKGSAMTPRHVQSIAYLVISEWIRRAIEERKAPGSKCRSLMGTMGTGEGKSLVFAMLACFAVKVLKLKVHILANTLSLKHRDCEDSKPFYVSMGVSVGESIDHKPFPDMDVVYTISSTKHSHLLKHYRDSISDGSIEGGNDFSKTLLLVDEVDSVVMCETPFLNWTRYDRPGTFTGSALFAAYLAVRAPGAENHDCPPGIDPAAWDQAKKDKRGLETFSLPVELTKNGIYVALDGKGEPDGLNHTELDYKNVRDGKMKSAPSGKSSAVYTSSLPHLLTRYATILGLSGSLGGDSEKSFLTECVTAVPCSPVIASYPHLNLSMCRYYNADFIAIPNFLNTCDNTEKCEPVLVDGGVHVVSSDAALQSKVVELALSKRKKVPVVIICGKNNSLRKNLLSTIKAKSSSSEKNVIDIAAGYENISELVDKATKFDTTHSVWPVSVVDYEGGRGQDYYIIDKTVDQDGGLMVIMTEVPDAGVKEWVQWKGRTSRSDRRGQYAVVLLEANISQKHRGLPKVPGAQSIYEGVALLDELLKEKDSDLKVKLKENAALVRPYSALKFVQRQFNQFYSWKCNLLPAFPLLSLCSNLCDDFYKHFRPRLATSGIFECAWFREMEVLSEFLGRYDHSDAAISAKRRELGL
jgi:hypothetical protein